MLRERSLRLLHPPLHPPLHVVHVVTLGGYRHGSFFVYLRHLPRPRSFLFESSTSAYFLGTYDRPRVVLFCLATWAGAGRCTELRGHLHLPITLLLSLFILQCPSFSFFLPLFFFLSVSFLLAPHDLCPLLAPKFLFPPRPSQFFFILLSLRFSSSLPPFPSLIRYRKLASGTLSSPLYVETVLVKLKASLWGRRRKSAQ